MSKISKLSTPTAPSKIDAFLDRLATQPAHSGRLIFAIDATQSRQETWDVACSLTADMFEAAAASGNLEISICYYRGARGECKASGWMTDAGRLSAVMGKISCEGGHTQLNKVLNHASKAHPIAALVFVGDAMEESHDALCAAAGRLRAPAFMFLEGDDKTAAATFREIARITGGAFVRFDAGAAEQLKELLRAVAAYAAGGQQALKNMSTNPGAVRLLQQLKE